MDTGQILAQLTAERGRIDAAIKLLSGMGSATKVAAKAPKTRKRRKMSKEARARIAAAQKKRWAAVKAKKKGA